MFRLPPPTYNPGIGEQLVQSIMAGLQMRQAAEERKLEKEQMQYRLRAMKFQEDQQKQAAIDAEAAKKRDEFSFLYKVLSGQRAPVGDVSNGISGFTGIPESDPMAALAGAGGAPINLEGGPGAPLSLPRTDMRGAAPIGQNPELQVPGTNLKVRPPTLDDAIRMKAEEDAREAAAKIRNVYEESRARELGQREIARALPTPLTPTADERLVTMDPEVAKMEGLENLAGKTMPKGTLDALISANRHLKSEKRADERLERTLTAEERRAQRNELKAVKDINAQWNASPGIKEAVQSDQFFNNFNVAADQYEKRLREGKPVGEAEEALIINRLRTFEADSVVREGEFARALSMSPLWDRFKQLTARVVKGGQVPPGFVAEARQTMNELKKFRDGWLVEQAAPFVAQAKAQNLPMDQFAFSKYLGSKFAPTTKGTRSLEDILSDPRYNKK